MTREDDDYFGDPVIEAARLCARCEAGQILATELVRLMAGGAIRTPDRPLGALELKGSRTRSNRRGPLGAPGEAAEGRVAAARPC